MLLSGEECMKAPIIFESLNHSGQLGFWPVTGALSHLQTAAFLAVASSYAATSSQELLSKLLDLLLQLSDNLFVHVLVALDRILDALRSVCVPIAHRKRRRGKGLAAMTSSSSLTGFYDVK